MTADIQNGPVARALAAIPSGCAVLTARRGDVSTGMLASWVQQAGFEPPMVTVAVKKQRPIADLIRRSNRFVLNLLAEGDTQAMFRHFGRGFAPGEPAFEGLGVEMIDCGVRLTDTLADLSCELSGELPTGDHIILAGTVVDARAADIGKPYVHLRKTGLSY